MLTKDQCRELALKHLGIQNERESKTRILDKETLEFAFGWVFYWQSKKFLETGDIMFMYVGNAPVLVDKLKGTAQYTGTFAPTEHFIDMYLIQNYKERFTWSIDNESLQTLQNKKTHWLNAVKKAYDCSSAIAIEN